MDECGNINHLFAESMMNTVESCDYAPPPLCMLALGKSGEVAYLRDPYISACHDHYRPSNAAWACELRSFSGLMDKTQEKQQSKA